MLRQSRRQQPASPAARRRSDRGTDAPHRTGEHARPLGRRARRNSRARLAIFLRPPREMTICALKHSSPTKLPHARNQPGAVVGNGSASVVGRVLTWCDGLGRLTGQEQNSPAPPPGSGTPQGDGTRDRAGPSLHMRSRRSRLIDLRRAVVASPPRGFSGTPSARRCSNASMNASWTISSTRPASPSRAASAARIRVASSRDAFSRSSAPSTLGGLRAGPGPSR